MPVLLFSRHQSCDRRQRNGERCEPKRDVAPCPLPRHPALRLLQPKQHNDESESKGG
jgi:hypothetical protein